MPTPPCCATHQRSTRGVFREGGACALTRRSMGLPVDGGAALCWVKCIKCSRSACFSCLDKLSEKLHKLLRTDGFNVLQHVVWAAFSARGWHDVRGGGSSHTHMGALAWRGGGVVWCHRDGCPFCLEQRVTASVRPVPRLLLLAIGAIPPRIRYRRTLLVPAFMLLPSGRNGPLLTFTVEVVIVDQVVPDHIIGRTRKEPAYGNVRCFPCPSLIPSSLLLPSTQ
jgi:hypothetical protein